MLAQCAPNTSKVLQRQNAASNIHSIQRQHRVCQHSRVLSNVPCKALAYTVTHTPYTFHALCVPYAFYPPYAPHTRIHTHWTQGRVCISHMYTHPAHLTNSLVQPQRSTPPHVPALHTIYAPPSTTHYFSYTVFGQTKGSTMQTLHCSRSHVFLLRMRWLLYTQQCGGSQRIICLIADDDVDKC